MTRTMAGNSRVEDAYPLSPLQEGLLFHCVESEVGRSLYVSHVACRLVGLDRGAFERAFQALVDHHPVLRTAFVWEGVERPLQVVGRKVRLPLAFEDWRELSEAEREARLDAYLAAERRRGFDPARAPLMRLALFRTGERDYAFVYSHHHLILDGWSIALLLGELFRLYEAYVAGREASLGPVRRFRDYVAWLGRRDPAAAEAFWRRQLAGFSETTVLGADHAPGAAPSGRRERATLRLGAEETTRLVRWAARGRVTPATVAQGVWALLLRRASGSPDVAYGTVVSGRPADLPGAEAMLGLFINTLPVRVRLEGDPPVLAWLGRLQRRLGEIADHAHLPLNRVQAVSDLPGGRPLFETLLLFENYPTGGALEGRNGSLRIEDLRSSIETHYPISVTVTPGERLAVTVTHDPGRIDATTARRLLAGFAAALRALPLDASLRVSAVPLSTAAERHQLLAEWNDTARAAPAWGSVPEALASRASARRDGTAVVSGAPGSGAPEHTSYGELELRARRLARRLRAGGIGPGDVVGLRLERSPALLVGLLGAWKAGAAFLPIDPDLPPARVEYVLADARPRLVVTAHAHWDPGAAGGAAEPVFLDRHGRLEGAEGRGRSATAADPGPPASRRDLAYLLYTSGTTGRPKGVAVERGAVEGYLAWALEALFPGGTGTVPVLSRPGFDASLKQMLCPLLDGGTVHLLPEGVLAEPKALVSALAAGRAGTVNCVPSLWEALLTAHDAAAPGGGLEGVRRVLLGGEALSPELVARTRRTLPGARVTNLYGPTEATANATASRVDDGWPGGIGRPIAHVRAHVLDRGLVPVPPGVAGELCLAGGGLARGYLGRPAGTAERFVPDPHGGPGERLYRTGDRVRQRGDGELEFRGRIDHQVKVRGFRIEPGEVESVLREHERVGEAVVAVHGEVLVAYVVGVEGEPPPAEALRDHAAGRLPGYMVPSAWVALPELPLTPNGKVDRRALPAPSAGEGVAAPEGSAADDPVRGVVAAVWSQVLGTGPLAGGESFFELGGHSLLAVQVLARLRDALGVELSVRELFDSPTVAALARRIEALRRQGTGREAPPLLPADRSRPLPLSFAQERLWFLDRLEPGSPAYNVPSAVRVEGDLAWGRFTAAVRGVVARHEALRTRFVETADGPVQAIDEVPRPGLGLVDLCGLPEARREALAGELAAREARRPFDLSSGPLLRVLGLRLAPAEHRVVLTLHHAVSDGGSTAVLVRELVALYGGEALPPLPSQYADYAAWQRRWLSGDALERELDRWRERLAGVPPGLPLPLDRPRPARWSGRVGSRGRRLPAALAEAVEALARREGATLFMTLLAAWQGLLSRVSGEHDVVVGTPVAGRSRVELEPLIGLFVNTLVLRGEVTAERSFRELVAGAREEVLDAHAHQELPFERLVEELAPERNLAQTPLFQVMFQLHELGGGPPPPTADLAVAPEDLGEPAAKFDLTLAVNRRPGRLGLSLEYASDLFDATTVERLLARFERLVSSAVSAPDLPLAEIPLLSAAERHQLLAEWSDTERPEPWRSIPERVWAQVAERPDAVAVASESEQVSYGELGRRAESLAAVLRGRGVGPEVRVAIALERSVEQGVAALAVLRAGGAYVPIDPAYPEERRRYVLADSGARVVLTRGREEASGRRDSPAVLAVGALPEAPAREPSWPAIGPAELACVIYTSGSTGRPKGVALRHGGLVNRLSWSEAAYRMSPADRVLRKSSFSFDISIWELFGTLAAGARVVLAAPGREGDGDYLARTIAEQGVTLVDFVPSVLRVFLEAEGVEACRNLRYVTAGGEALSAALRDRYFERLSAPLRNQYGPTEISIDTTDWVARRESVPGPVSLGRPLANARLRVLDAALRPVPLGTPGELGVGGAGVARGYLGLPALTAERFVPDPWGEPGARLYRTGDRVRHRGDGELEFHGRIDHQVKVRGFRIEPGEVEAVVREHPRVGEAVVVVRGDVLVAYVVGVEREPPSAETLRAHAAARLPAYMVPSAWVTLPELPLTPSGKVDARALPAPERGATAAFVAPRTPVEEVLAGIFAEVLDLDRVGVEEGFFALGGHSLLATRLVSRVREAMGVELALRELFEAPTVAGLARRVEALRWEGTGRELPPLAPADRSRPLPLSFAQERLWFLDRLDPGSSAYNVPSAVRAEGTLAWDRFAAAVAGVVARHEVLRTRFVETTDGPVQAIDAPPQAQVRAGLVDLSGLPESRRRALAHRLTVAEARRPFDLAAGPLFRVLGLRLAPAEHGVALTMHHSISDGWSMEILIRELVTLYGGGSLSPLPVQYADYATWQRRWLSHEVLERELDYWRQRLAGVPPVLPLPLDRPRPARWSGRGGTRGHRLSVTLSEALGSLARREGATLFMTLLAAWQAVLSRVSGADDVVVGTPVAGRPRLELEPLIGLFVNTLVLRSEVTGERSFRDQVAEAREAMLDAHAHQELPFERLVEELAPERSLAHSPLFQVMFTLEHGATPPGRVEGLRLELAGDGTATTKFDLSLAAMEGRGGLHLSLEYAADLFDATTVDRLLDRFERLLAAAAASPERALAEHPLLSPAERHQLLAEWNEAAGRIAPGGGRWRGMPERLREQASARPEAVAVAWGGACLSYGELGVRAAGLSARLRSAGVAPEARVGVAVARGLDLVVALWGVLEAGAAYLPLDPSYPEERLRWMLEDAGVEVVVTDAAWEAKGPDLPRARRILLAGPAGGPDAAGAPTDAGVATAPEQLSHVIYTSGSTGRPKGVAVRHGGVAALADWAATAFGPEAWEGVLAATSASFDLSVFEILVPLSLGGRVVGVENALSVAGRRDLDRVRLVNTVPSALRELVGLGELPPSTDRICLAGEALPRDLVESILGRWPGVSAVWNLYGPSEDTTYSTGVRLDRGCVGETPPIGRPLAGRRAWVADRRLHPAPLGTSGELCVGGAGVARGYLGRPALTAERFVPDPCGEPGGRLYRTGDLARHRGGGELEFLGRIDHQVKLRGFRIEPGEIESVLRGHPRVGEAVVAVRDEVLVAYVVGVEGEPPPAETLREHAAARLPAYMVPAAWVALPELPLTPSAKVDRRALPAPERGVVGFVAPRTPVEEVLAGIWAAVLGLERVGVEDDFFALGGHSLLATRVVSRVREALGTELPLRALFEAPTVAGLARQVASLRRRSLGLATLPLSPVPGRAETELSFPQRRLWFLEQLQPGRPTYNIPTAATVRGPLSVHRLEQALSEVVRRHEALRTRFERSGGEPRQVVAPAPRSTLPVADLSGLPEAERESRVEALTRAEAARPFDLSHAPLLRVRLVRLVGGEQRLLLTLHHIAADGWSIALLMDEVAALYGAWAEGRPSPLPELVLQYGDYAHWQRAWLATGRLEPHLEYWRGQLQGAPPRLALPTDRPRSPARRGVGGQRMRALDPELATALKSLARGRSATLFMVLLAGFQSLLGRWAQQEDVVVGTPVANRNHLAVEGLIGFFLNWLALRTDLADEPSFEGLLARVRGTALEGFAHQEAPFELLLEALQPERSLAHTPFFQVVFNLVDFESAGVRLDEPDLQALAPRSHAATFDLTLYARSAGERIELFLVYDTELFEATTAERMLAHLHHLLAAAAAAPRTRASTLPLLSEAEHREVLAARNRVAPVHPFQPFARGDVEGTIPARFARVVALGPDRVAVKTPGGAVTYGELARRADAVAAALLARGGETGDRAALLFDPGAPMLAAVLGSLAAGRVYVPLDPTNPPRRLALVLRDAGASTILTAPEHAALACELVHGAPEASLPVVDVEALPASAAPPVAPSIDPGAAAYILYTSGSTGEPKGVVQSHRNALHHAAAYTNALHVAPGDRLSLLASFAFDAAVMDVFGALLNGAELVPAALRRDGFEATARWLRGAGVTLYHATPTVFRQMAPAFGPRRKGGGLPSARAVVLGGEEVVARDLATFREVFPGECLLVNGLGPTESTTALQLFVGPRSAGRPDASGSVPVGFPVEETEVRLLDDAGEDVGILAVGEIAIVSPWVALGYWRRPELTAAAFSGQGRMRTYRTGDLGRRLPDGAIEFAGRKDAQVKIRGHRVESGEVEALLAAHPAVREAVVLGRPQPAGGLGLAAWVVPAPGAEVDRRELLRSLAERLPSYMVPFALTVLPELPLTPTGKVDRKALPDPEPGAAEEAGGGELRGPIEEVLGEIWCDLLGLAAVDRNESFFDLGGHSLAGVRMMARLREALDVELPLAQLFSSPTIGGLAGAVAELRAGPAVAGLGAQPIPRRPEGAEAPLSFAQQRLWFLEHLAGPSAVYNMPVALALVGSLAPAAFEQAVGEVERRQEALRTRLPEADGVPVQRVAPHRPRRLALADLSGLPGAAAAAEADRLRDVDARRPFDLASGPLFRARLLRLDGARHHLLAGLHHTVGDGWSLDLLVGETAELYAALGAGRPSPLPELPVQYADFAAWQRRVLGGEALERLIGFWKDELAGAPPLVDLPLDRPRPEVRSVRGGERSVRLPGELAAALAALGRRRGVTLFMVLTAALQALLLRLTGAGDVCLGTPVAGRDRREIEGVVGLFVNTLVLRARPRREAPFEGLLDAARETALAAFAHQHLPFERLVDELGVRRDMSHPPVFQVMLVLQNQPRSELSASDLSLSALPVEDRTAKFDLTFVVVEARGELDVRLEYARDLFDATTAGRLLAQWRTLLAGVADAPERRLADLPLLGRGERHQLLREWAGTSGPWPRDASLAVRVAEQAALRPDAAAVEWGGEVLTYGGLRRRAAAVAAALADRGVGRGAAVGLAVERSPEMVVGMLAALWAGGAYVPLDPSYPRERLLWMLADAGVAALLADGDGIGGPGGDLPVLRLDRPLPAVPDPLPEPVAAAGDDLAYVIYTSGSTGRPKGVAVPQRAVARLAVETDYVTPGPGRRVGQAANASFDATTFEVWTALLAGGTVVGVDREATLDPAAFGRLLATRRIDSMFLTTSLFNQVARAQPRVFSPLDELLVGGEALDPRRIREVLAQEPPRRLLNGYGPTESTTFAVWKRIEHLPREAVSVPIGRALAHTRTWVLDGDLRPVPAGVTGDLWLGGDGLARGYLGRPARTAEAFCPDPVSGAPGGRLYATGDRARRLADGEIDFLGRLDDQVKVRGFRIEPGEIEAVLEAHPAVAQAVVLVREEAPGERRLVAYLVAAPSASGDPAARMAAWLGERLPPYMVPTAFVALDALPLTPNGKLDREALAAIETARSVPAGDARPETPTESILAGLWSELLGAPAVMPEDDFFDLGGHSLLVMRLVSRLRATFEIEIGPAEVFDHPTVAGLAARIDVLSREAAGLEVPPLTRSPRPEEIPLSFSQERLWFLQQLDPRSAAAFNVRFDMRLDGPLAVSAFTQAVGEVVRRHEALRTRFEAVAGRPVQRVEASAEVPLPVVDLRDLAAADRRRELAALARRRARRGFDLAALPLLSLTLVRLASHEHAVLAAVHHIVSDDWSGGVLMREVGALYAALGEGRPSPLPELAFQYADFALWQRGWLRGETLEAELDFWRERFAGAPEGIELPLDRPRPPVRSLRGARRRHALPPGLKAALAALGVRHGATLYMALLAGFAALLHRYSGQRDLLLGSPVANRTEAELEGLVGFFVNTLVLRIDVGGGPTFEDLLARARRVCLEAYAHRHLPFEQVVEALQPERDLSHNPLFQVLFVFQAAGAPEVEPGELSIRPLVAERESSMFDLVLSLAEVGERLAVLADFSRDLFDGATVARALRHLETLLAGAVEAPERPLAELAFLTPPEAQQLLCEWNDVPEEPPGPRLLHEMVSEHVRARPEAVAVVDGGVHVSYGTLGERTAALAGRLAAEGTVPGDLVGVLGRRGLEQVASVAGVLAAGAGFLPLDPDHPAERLRDTLADAGARAVVVAGGLAYDPGPGGPPVVRPEAAWNARPPGAAGRGLGAAHPDQPAYAIYTSGSTGRPKGVVVPHRGVVDTLLWRRRRFRVGPGDRILATVPPTFDPSVWQTFGALGNGACLVLAPPDAGRDAAGLVRLLAREAITITDFPPSLLEVLLDEGGEEEGLEAPALRHLFCGGEALPRRLVDRFAGRSAARLHNVYGPTETSIDAASWTCVPGPAAQPVPIGRPIGGKRLHVLDRELRPVPAGVAGELWIGGAGLSRGYAGRPAETAASFRPDPFAGSPGRRLYRSGDVARHRAGGELEFLGRADDQVKIRGFRVELGEVEAALVAHPDVAEAAVVLGEGPAAGEAVLVGYVGAPRPVAPEDLAAFLRGRLPGYMVPAVLVVLDALPRSPNGKVDRRALPPPVWASRAVHAAPEGAVEEALAAIWKDLLDRGRIGREDGFFELGGHSLLATRLASRVRSELGVELPVRRIFEAPRLREQAAEVRRLRSLGGAAGEAPVPPPLVPVPRDEPPPLSFGQQRLWFLHQLAPESAAYHVARAHRIAVEAPPALEAALAEVVRRHETLRTAFPARDGEPVQAIAPARARRVPVVDLRGLSGADRGREEARVGRVFARRPFDLEAEVPVRLALVLDGGPPLLRATLHHIVGDGWSAAILDREVSALLAAGRAGRPSPLPELPVQYADFAHWQRRWLSGAVLEAEVGYWRRRLEGMAPALDLPTDRPRPAVSAPRGAWLALPPVPGLGADVERLARAGEATPFMVLLAAVGALLSRLSGELDLAVGSPVAGRDRAEIEGLIGFFVNTLVLRVELAGRPSFGELLARVRETALGAYAHQHLPFEKLVEELDPERSLARTPFFQVMLGYDEAGRSAPSPGTAGPPGAAAPAAEVGSGKFDLNFSLAAWPGGGLATEVSYDAGLFDPTTVARWARYLEPLLRAAVAAPERPVAELPILGAAERHQVAWEWSGSPSPRPAALPCPALVAEWVGRTPDAVAVVHEESRLSYRELGLRAGRLARAVAAAGREAGGAGPVAVCLERSPEMIVAILAAQLAGAPYVPLDPELPPARRAFCLADSGAAVLVTRRELVADLPDWRGPSLFVEEAEAWAVEGRGGGDGALRGLVTTPAGERLAYVIYTSGSTGRPKGVAISHGQLATYLAALDDVLGEPATPSFATVSTVAADLGNTSIFFALGRGGALHVVSEERVRDPSLLADYLASRPVDGLKIVPSHLAALLDTGSEAVPAAGRWLVVGGEALGVDLVARLRRAGLGPGAACRVLNHYGPTETTVGIATHRLPADLQVGPGPVPVGRPLAGSGVFAVDAELEPVAPGVVGELVLGGPQVARGYLGRPRETAARFVPSPWGASPGKRLYRSGDRGRFRADGTLEFLGRGDDQVKIRGHRVEPAEVASALAVHPAVGEAAVVARVDPAGETRLVAYLTAASGSEAGGRAVPPAALREHLAARLPEAMIPSLFIFLPGLPRTANGKLDRRALPEPAWGGRRGTAAGEGAVAPRDRVEAELVRLWEELLEVRPIGVRDDFFVLGGHSLLAVRLRARVEAAFGREVPLVELLRHPTVETLARWLTHGEPAAGSGTLPRGLVPLAAGGRGRPLFLVHEAGGSVEGYRALAARLGGARPVYGIEAGASAEDGDPASVEAMAAGYLEAVRAVEPTGPWFLGGWSFGGLVAFEMARRLEAAGEAVGCLALLDAPPPGSGEEGAGEGGSLPRVLAFFAHQAGLAVDRDELEGAAPEVAVRRVAEAGVAAGLLPASGAEEYLRHRLALLDRNLAARSRYRAAGRIDAPVVYLRPTAEDTPGTPGADDPTRGWDRRCRRPVRLHLLPGDHWSFLTEPEVAEVARLLEEAMAEGAQATPAPVGQEGP